MEDVLKYSSLNFTFNSGADMMHCLPSAGATSRLWLFGIIGCVMLPGIAAGQAAPPATPASPTSPVTAASDADLVPQITARMRDNVKRLPNYTCTETIERTNTSPDGKLLSEDTVHLEVALIENKEMFAWPGSTEFGDSGLGDLVTTGNFGSGAFALYTKIVFLNQDRPKLRPQGRVDLSDLERGDGLLQYDFTVLQSQNEFRINEGPRSAIVGFEGSIYVDPETLDLRRLVVNLTDIPPQFALKGASDQVNYDRVPFGEEHFLLPVSNRLITENSTAKSQNRVRFEKCHRFEGESTLSFEDPVLPEDTKQEGIQEVEIPPDTSVHIRMDPLHKPNNVAVGDLITGQVSDSVEVNGKELIPKGTKVKARVLRMDRTSPLYVLGFRVTDIEWKGKHASMDGYIERLPEAGALGMTLLSGPGEKESMIAIVQQGPGVPKILTYWRTFSDIPQGPVVSSAATPGSTASNAEQKVSEAVSQEVAIPPDTSVHIVMDFKRTLDKMVVGDPVTGKLSDRVQVDGKELIPKGAKVSARVVNISGDRYGYILELRVTDIEWKGKHAKMDGYIERLPASEAIELDPQRRIDLLRSQKSSVISIPRLAAKSVREMLTYWRTF